MYKHGALIPKVHHPYPIQIDTLQNHIKYYDGRVQFKACGVAYFSIQFESFRESYTQ